MNVVEIKEVLKEVRYLNWEFDVIPFSGTEIPRYLQIRFDAPCTTTDEDLSWKGRKWILSQHMTVSEIVTTAFKAVLTAIEHEARESFLYRGMPIFGPHINVNLLVQIYQNSRNVLDIREPTITEEEHGTRTNTSRRIGGAIH